MEIRATKESDVLRAPWPLRAHGFPEGTHSFVQTNGTHIVAAVSRAPSPIHPARDSGQLHLTPGADPAPLLDLVRWAEPTPITFTASLGSPEHAALIAAGARAYQNIPAQLVPELTTNVRQWCERHLLLDIEDLVRYDDSLIVDMWSTYYEILHSPWEPCAEHEVLLKEFASAGSLIDKEHSGFVSDHGVPVAAAFCFPCDRRYDGRSLSMAVCVEALVPDHAWAREAVASLMARVLLHAPGEVMFDGHGSDPHFAPLLTELPDVVEGRGCPEDMLEL